MSRMTCWGVPGELPPSPDLPLIARLGLNRYVLEAAGNAQPSYPKAEALDELRYVHEWGWLYWDGRRWQRDTIGHAHRCAQAIARGLWREAVEHDDPDERKELAKHAARSESSSWLGGLSGLSGMLDIAEVHQKQAVYGLG